LITYIVPSVIISRNQKIIALTVEINPILITTPKGTA